MSDNGDSALIVTQYNKKILIDGGGSKNRESFDVGEKILLPYLLDRRIKTLDYIMISHFDEDHCGGLVTILEEFNIKNVVISNQVEISKEFEDIYSVIRQKRINVLVVKEGDRLSLDKETYIDIIYPEKQLKYEDLNNNSIVCKLIYKGFSILFTGDIEAKAEKYIFDKYKDTNVLNSTIIKVAHHGSKGSSTEDFIKSVNPKIAMIGVGANNTFGHPADIVLDRLKEIGCKTFRTDVNGELKIRVNIAGRIWIDKMLN